MSLLLAAVLCASSAHAPLVFGVPGGGWMSIASDGTSRTFTTVADIAPMDVAFSADQRRAALVTAQGAEPSVLTLVADSKVVRTVSVANHHLEAPAVSADGNWVYFTGRDKSPVPHSQSMQYTQLWRVAFLKGEPERLTSSSGCHHAPRQAANGDLLFIHATCSFGRGVEVMSPTARKERVLIPPLTEIGMVAADQSGLRLAYTRFAPGGTELIEYTASQKKERSVALLEGEGLSRLAFDPDGTSFLYQQRGVLWRLKPGSPPDRLHDFSAQRSASK